MIEHIALSARGGTLHLLQGVRVVDGYHQPVTGRAHSPLHLFSLYRCGEIHDLCGVAALRKCHHLVQLGRIGLADGDVAGNGIHTVGGNGLADVFQFARRLVDSHRRTAKGPSRTGVHV